MNDFEETESTHDLTTKCFDIVHDFYLSGDKVEKYKNHIVYLNTPNAIYDPKSNQKNDNTVKDIVQYPVFLDQNNTSKEIKNESKMTIDDRILELKNEIECLDVDQESKYCFPKDRRGKFYCLAVIVFILIVLGTILFFLWPRIPDFDLESVELTNSEPKISGSKLNFNLKYPLNLKIKVFNPNYYNIQTNSIHITAFISPNLTQLSQTNFPGSEIRDKVDDYMIGQSVLSSTIFPLGRTKNFTMILNIDYTPNPKYGALNDPSLGDILRVCSDQGRKTKDTIKIVYHIDIGIGILSSFGYRPRIAKDIKIQCPISSSVLGKVTGNGG